MIIEQIINKIKVTLYSNERYISFLRKKGVTIGKDCSIQKDVVFGTEPYLITIGNKVRLTSGVKLFTHDGGFWVLRNLKVTPNDAEVFGRIVIGNNVNIGWNAIIMPGVTIGDNVIIGCGAIITKDVPSNSVVAGIPGRVIESIEEYAEKNLKRIVLTKNMPEHEKRELLLKEL